MNATHAFHRLAARAFCALVLLLAFAGIGHAQKLCIPAASGVPALSGAPNFLDPAAPGPAKYWPRLDDPRWRGALARSFGSGASQEASFRALRVAGATPAIYLSWFIPVDSQLDPFFDSLRVAFSPGGGAADQMIDVIPFTSLAASLEAAVPPSTQTRLLSGGVWTVQAAEPAWVAQNTRVWLDTGTQMWGINMRVPVQGTATYDTGIRMSPTFNMAFELQVGQAGGGVVYYRFSDSVPLTDLGTVAAVGTWPLMSIEASPAGCAAGVSLTSTNVGTTYVDAGSTPRPNRIRITGTNTFFAQPTNQTGGTVAAGLIAGTFRIGNWGSQPDWNDIPDPTTSLWKQLNTTLVTNAGPIANTATASVAGGNALTFAWTPTFAERCELTGRDGVPAAQAPDGVAIPGNPACPNGPPTRRLHQCILVELSGGGFTYTPQSIYRNMDYVNASTFEREAEISVAGLAPAGGAPRDVYLYVQKFNMPQDVAAPEPSPSLVDHEQVQEVLRSRGEVIGATAPPLPPPPPTPPVGGDFDTLNQIYPTYIVYAFRDTGATVNIGGQSRKVLKPQSSFGYYVDHQGALYGWDTALVGAEEIAPNYYRIGVPEGGTATVSTRIVAAEEPRHGFSWWWWIVVVIFAALLLA